MGETTTTGPPSGWAMPAAPRAKLHPGAVALAALCCALLAVSPAAAKFDPERRWRTTETPHFAIRYPDGCDDLAGRVAVIAEEVHARLAPRIGWTPRERTQLIVADETDAAGGWATPYPYNQILITTAAPAGEFGLGAARFDDWLRLVITHEYTHVLQLDMASRLPLALRSVFGRLYFPNALQPEWLVEGLATFEETDSTAGGRGRSPGAEMVLRMAALEGRVPTLDQMAVFPDAWPAGQVPYLFGESLLRRIAARYGRDTLAALSQAYGGRLLPFLVESTGRDVLGEGYRDLWREWSAGLAARFAEQERAVTALGLTPSTALTDNGYVNSAPAWSPDGRRIAWLRADGRERPGIWVMGDDGSGRRRLPGDAFRTASLGASLAWSPDGSRLFYAKPGYVRGAAVVSDIWAYDIAAGRETRVTRGLRARDPDPSPDGRTLALVTAARGRTQLALLELDGALPARQADRLRPLTERSAEQYARPRWSPDGLRIAVSVRVPGDGQEIRVLDRTGRTLARTGRNSALDAAPVWSPDGRRLYFSSDRTGIFNLFCWDPATGEVAQVTNVLGGAFSPAPASDGRRLAFVDYSARGYDIRVARLDGAVTTTPGGGQALAESEGVQPAGAGPAPTEGPAGAPAPLASRPYSPLDTIGPRLWFPWIAVSRESGTLAGFATGGQDVLQRHRYTLIGLYGPESGRLMHTATYAYDGLRPTLSLSSWDLDRTYAGLLRDTNGAADYTERSRAVGLEATLGFPGFEGSQAISLGYRYRELSALSHLPPWPGYGGALPAVGSLGSSRLAWTYSSTHRQPFSISPEDGQQIELGLERYQKGFGSERSFTVGTADWRGYLSLPAPRHVLATRVFVGSASGDASLQGAFSLGGDAPGDIGYALDDRILSLRGYPLNAFRGEHAALAGLEYRFPLLEIGRGGVSVPFFLRRLHGALFVDAGEAWDEGGFRSDALKTSVGAEVRLDVFFSYFLPLTVRLGVAVGLDEEGGIYPTLGIWMPQGFLGASTPTQRR